MRSKLLILFLVLLIVPSIALAEPFSVSEGAGKAWSFLTKQHEIGGPIGKVLAAIGSNPIGKLALGFFGINVEGRKVTTSVGEMLLNLTMVAGVGVAAKVFMGARVAARGAKAVGISMRVGKAIKQAKNAKTSWRTLKALAANIPKYEKATERMSKVWGLKKVRFRLGNYVDKRGYPPPAYVYPNKPVVYFNRRDAKFVLKNWNKLLRHEIHHLALRNSKKFSKVFFKGANKVTKLRLKISRGFNEAFTDWSAAVRSKRYSHWRIKQKRYGPPGTLTRALLKYSKTFNPKWHKNLSKLVKRTKHALPSIGFGLFKPKKSKHVHVKKYKKHYKKHWSFKKIFKKFKKYYKKKYKQKYKKHYKKHWSFKRIFKKFKKYYKKKYKHYKKKRIKKSFKKRSKKRYRRFRGRRR